MRRWARHGTELPAGSTKFLDAARELSPTQTRRRSRSSRSPNTRVNRSEASISTFRASMSCCSPSSRRTSSGQRVTSGRRSPTSKTPWSESAPLSSSVTASLCPFHRIGCRPDTNHIQRRWQSSPRSCSRCIPGRRLGPFDPLVDLLEHILIDAAQAGALQSGLDCRRVAGILLQVVMFDAFAATIWRLHPSL